jgi:hypothetical protein
MEERRGPFSRKQMAWGRSRRPGEEADGLAEKREDEGLVRKKEDDGLQPINVGPDSTSSWYFLFYAKVSSEMLHYPFLAFIFS